MFYAELYDRAFELIDAYGRSKAESGVFHPDSEDWDEYVGQLALLTVFDCADAFRRAEEADDGLKYLLDDNGKLTTDLDTHLDPLAGWFGVVGVDNQGIEPFVKHPLPEKNFHP